MVGWGAEHRRTTMPWVTERAPLSHGLPREPSFEPWVTEGPHLSHGLLREHICALGYHYQGRTSKPEITKGEHFSHKLPREHSWAMGYLERTSKPWVTEGETLSHGLTREYIWAMGYQGRTSISHGLPREHIWAMGYHGRTSKPWVTKCEHLSLELPRVLPWVTEGAHLSHGLPREHIWALGYQGNTSEPWVTKGTQLSQGLPKENIITELCVTKRSQRCQKGYKMCLHCQGLPQTMGYSGSRLGWAMCYQNRNFTKGYQGAQKSHGLPWDTTRPDNGHCVTGSTRNIKMVIDGLCESISNILSIIVANTVFGLFTTLHKILFKYLHNFPFRWWLGVFRRTRRQSPEALLSASSASARQCTHITLGHLASTYTQLLVWWWLRGRGGSRGWDGLRRYSITVLGISAKVKDLLYLSLVKIRKICHYKSNEKGSGLQKPNS